MIDNYSIENDELTNYPKYYLQIEANKLKESETLALSNTSHFLHEVCVYYRYIEYSPNDHDEEKLSGSEGKTIIIVSA